MPQPIINKFLTEEMDECWHEWVFKITKPTQNLYQCTRCNKTSVVYAGITPKRNDFFTPDGFFKLWEWAQEQDWWDHFYETRLCTTVKHNTFQLRREYVNPKLFAEEVMRFLTRHR